MAAIVDKLYFGFIVIAAVYVALLLFGFVNFDETISIFNLIIGVFCFGLGYKLTEQGFLVYNTKKLIPYGIILGFSLGIVIFIFQAATALIDIKTLQISFDFLKVVNYLSTIVIEIIVTTPTLVAGSFLYNLQKTEKEKREGW